MEKGIGNVVEESERGGRGWCEAMRNREREAFWRLCLFFGAKKWRGERVGEGKGRERRGERERETAFVCIGL